MFILLSYLGSRTAGIQMAGLLENFKPQTWVNSGRAGALTSHPRTPVITQHSTSVSAYAV